MRYLRTRDIIVAAAIMLAACSPARPADEMMGAETPMAESMPSGQTPVADEMMSAVTPAADAMMGHETMPTESAEMEGNAAAMAADWMSVPLTNAATGQEFRLSDFGGKVVLVETMAVWCTNCRNLQGQIRSMHEQLGDQAADLVTVSLDVDPNEDTPYLKSYVEQTGFDWAFAVAPAEVSRALAGEYGDLFLNPPSTPLLVIDRDGAAHALAFGPKSASFLLDAVHPFLQGGM